MRTHIGDGYMKNAYEVRGDHVVIFLNTKKGIIEALIDIEDLEKMHQYKNSWYSSWHKHTNSYYVLGQIGNRKISLHRYVMGEPEGMFIDHINHDTLDNRKTNLRAVSRRVNGLNRKGAPKHSNSGIRGVQWSSEKEGWVVRIGTLEGRKYLGFSKDLDEAASILRDYQTKKGDRAKATYI